MHRRPGDVHHQPDALIAASWPWLREDRESFPQRVAIDDVKGLFGRSVAAELLLLVDNLRLAALLLAAMRSSTHLLAWTASLIALIACNSIFRV